jgi:hypothetical protein
MFYYHHDSVANDVCNVFAFITVSGIVSNHQIIKYVIVDLNNQTRIKDLIFAVANIDYFLILAKC